jgi:cytochrome c553
MDYMVKQLVDYSTDARINPVMGPIAKALNPTEREKVSEYYSGLTVPTLKPKQKVSTAIVKRGEKLAEIGDQKMQLQACSNCHGPGGVGVAPLIPGLASQHASYLEAQLRDWKSGQRKNSPNQMVQIAQRLDDASIKALTAYFEQVKVK